MNPGFDYLRPYPFQRLSALCADLPKPTAGSIDLSIGEPRDPTPEFILEALREHLSSSSRYPRIRGADELRAAQADWLQRRYRLPGHLLNPEQQILPVCGTREALFAVAQCFVTRRHGGALVALPNPFYQIYEGATWLAGAEPCFLPCPAEKGFLPDLAAVPRSIWQRCELLYLCSPGNPGGGVYGLRDWIQLLELADRHDFLIAADECYADIYLDEEQPPCGLLEACLKSGRRDFRRCLVFHSLSKRSNAPGLRSGFVAGDATLLKAFLAYRGYHGCAMPPFIQAASAVAWADDEHVRRQRQRYRERVRATSSLLAPLLPHRIPAGTFYLWPRTPVPAERFTRELYARHRVLVLPGSFLGRGNATMNPGFMRIRIALVDSLARCLEAARHIRDTARDLKDPPPPRSSRKSSYQQAGASKPEPTSRRVSMPDNHDGARRLIETAYERRAALNPDQAEPELRAAVAEALAGLDQGRLRVAEARDGAWIVHDWLKKAVLLSFCLEAGRRLEGTYSNYYDKIGLKFAGWEASQFQAAGVRVAPPALARYGSYIAPGTVMMPCYVNIGARVDSGSMLDTWVTVGSCAQIGKNVHLSGGVGIGGVLEPAQAMPTIIEDDCFIGARSEIVEGVVVGAGSVISMGVYIGQSTRIYHRAEGTVSYGRVPPGSVVVPGALPAPDGSHSLYCAVIVKRVDARTRSKVALNELLRDAWQSSPASPGAAS